MFKPAFALVSLLATTLMATAFIATAEAQEQQQSHPPATQPSQGLNGTWTWHFTGFGGRSMQWTFKLQQEGNKLTGTVIGSNDEESPIEDGQVNDAGEFSFKVTREFGQTRSTTTYTGKLEDGNLKGKSETVFVREFNAERAEE